MYLVDTSVLTRLRNPVVAAALRVLDDLRYCPISGLEYRFQAASESDYITLSTILDGFTRDPLPSGAFERADDVQRFLAAGGLKGRKVPDLVIAAHAELAGLTVLHYDRDYDHIASVTGQPTEWIAEPGEID